MEPSSDVAEFKKPDFLPDKYAKPKTVSAELISLDDARPTAKEADAIPSTSCDSRVRGTSSETTAETVEPSTDASDATEFKRPELLPDKFVKPKTVSAEPSSSNDAKPTAKEEDEILSTSCDSMVTKTSSETTAETVKLKTSFPPIPYAEPSWGGRPDKFYSLEEMKNGTSIRNIPLDTRSFYSFGRLECCHIVMAHPTISRYHAVLQFRSTFSSEDEKKGFYLYDLGSTHGTFLNKYRIKSKTYVKIQVGHMIKFGSSTRFFLLHGPDDDQEVESQLSYTELKEKRRQELEKREADYLQERAKLIGTDDDDDDSKGIDWGMGEDADATTDLSENPFALLSNEDMYKDDPKKCLKQWFEREGEQLHYHIEEKGFSQFRCTIELPIDDFGVGTVAEAVVSGRKKEAAFQCALEACRMLDRANLLRPSHQEARKRKMKNWEEDDYYDSDEDNFFDRTGELETKRKQRMKQVQKTQPATDTYETLIAKHEKVLKEIEEMEQKLNTMLNEARRTDDDENLDSLSFQKRSGQVLDKLEYKKTKTNLNTLKMDEDKLRKLINFVKPFELPEIKPPPVREIKEEPDEVIELKPKEIKTRDVVEKEKMIPPEQENSILKTDEPTPIPTSTKELNESSSIAKKPSNSKTSASKIKNKNSDRAKKIAQSFSNQYEEDFNNIVWTPPSGQTGDGRTSLNDRFGY